MFSKILVMLAFAAAAILFFVPILFARRDEFWRTRHHDHLIPPAPRIWRAGR